MRVKPTPLTAVGQRASSQPRRYAMIRWRHKVVSFVQEAKELVKAASQRIVFGCAAEMPFADETGYITRIVQAGKHTVSVWERYARSGARARLDVGRDLWLVMHVEPGKRDGSFDVYERPPRDLRWLPLIAVPR